MAFAALSFVACKKSDDAPAAATQSGSFTMNGITYATDTAVFTVSGKKVMLTIGNHDYVRLVNQKDSAAINMLVVNFEDTTLTAGTFTYDNSEDGANYDPKKNYFTAGVQTNFSIDRHTKTNWYPSADGSSIVVAVNNGIYTITYNFVTADKIAIKGTYTGPVAFSVIKKNTD